MAGEDLTLRMRTKGARTAAKDVDQTSRAVRGLDKSASGAAKRSGMLGRATGLLRSPFHHLRGEATGLAKSFIGMGLAFGSVEGIKKSIETTDELVKTTVSLHHQFGLSTEAASGLAGVLQTRGLNKTGLQMGLTQLSRQMQAMLGGSVAAEQAFSSLGITGADVSNALAAPDGLEKMFERVTERMTEMPGGAQKAVTGQLLLGRATRSLAPLLQEGALGLQQQMKWAKEFGVTLDGHTIGSVEEMAAAQTKAQYAALGLQIQLGQFLAPSLTTMNETFADTVKSFRDGRPEGNRFSKTLYRIGKDLEPVGKDLKEVGGYLVDHPRLLQAAGVAYIGYKTKLLGLLTMAPKAYLQGLITGRAFARGVAMGSAEGEGAAALAGAGRMGGGIFARAFLPAAAGVIGFELVNYLRKDPGHWMEHVHSALADAVNFVSPNTVKPAPSNKTVSNALLDSLRQATGVPASTTAVYGVQATGRGPHRHYTGDDVLRRMAEHPTKGFLPQFFGARIDHRGNPAVRHQLDLVEAILRRERHIIVESHNTIVMDGKPVAKSTHKQAVKAKSTR